MGKRQVAVTLRKPPPADTDAFVASAPALPPTSTALASRPLDEVVLRPDGRAFRELTVLLPAELARDLSVHCMESDRDVSNFLGELVRTRLDAPPPPVPEPTPTPSLRETLVELARASLWRFAPWAH